MVQETLSCVVLRDAGNVMFVMVRVVVATARSKECCHDEGLPQVAVSLTVRADKLSQVFNVCAYTYLDN